MVTRSLMPLARSVNVETVLAYDAEAEHPFHKIAGTLLASLVARKAISLSERA